MLLFEQWLQHNNDFTIGDSPLSSIRWLTKQWVFLKYNNKETVQYFECSLYYIPWRLLITYKLSSNWLSYTSFLQKFVGSWNTLNRFFNYSRIKEYYLCVAWVSQTFKLRAQRHPSIRGSLKFDPTQGSNSRHATATTQIPCSKKLLINLNQIFQSIILIQLKLGVNMYLENILVRQDIIEHVHELRHRRLTEFNVRPIVSATLKNISLLLCSLCRYVL